MVAEKPTGRYRWMILGISFVAQMSNALAAQAVAPLAPIFQPELGLTKAQVGLFSSAAFAGAWGVLLIAGSLTDRFGVRRMMSLGQMVTGGLVLCMSTVGSFLQAVAVMFAAGLGRGAAAPGVTKAIVDWFPPTARATALGLNQTAIPVAGIVTASTLPALALVAGWRASIAAIGFVIVAGGVVTALLYRDAQQSAAAARRADIQSSLKVVIRNRNLWIVSGMGPLLAGVQFSLITYLALYFKEVVLVPLIPEESARIVAAGGYLAICHAGGIFARVFWGMVSDRVFRGRRIVVLAIVSALSGMMSLVVSSLGSGHPAWLLSAIVFVYGATAMGWQGLYLVVAAETAGPGYAGTGVGLCMTGTQLGFVGGPPIFGLVLDVTGSYPSAWLLLASLCAIGAAMGTLMARKERAAEAALRARPE